MFDNYILGLSDARHPANQPDLPCEVWKNPNLETECLECDQRQYCLEPIIVGK